MIMNSIFLLKSNGLLRHITLFQRKHKNKHFQIKRLYLLSFFMKVFHNRLETNWF